MPADHNTRSLAFLGLVGLGTMQRLEQERAIRAITMTLKGCTLRISSEQLSIDGDQGEVHFALARRANGQLCFATPLADAA